MAPIIALQFHPTGRRYHFDAQGITDLQPGDRVVVKTTRGRQLGIVAGYVPKEKLDGRASKPIERRATPRDLVLQRQWQAKALGALVACREQAEKLGVKGSKFVKAEYSFDGSQVTILYTTEKKRTDLNILRRDLRRALRTQVELYQIGPRDFAKVLDGLGTCGEQRCCTRFLTRFSSVSIRMAKLQNISLTPSEITGACGRLRCCLAYENSQYAEAAKGLPKRGKEVVTPHGSGRVIEVRTLAGTIVVDVGGVRHEVQREDIGKEEFTNPPVEEKAWPDWLSAEPVSESPAPSQPAEEQKKRSRSRRRPRRRPKKRSESATSQRPASKPRTGGTPTGRKGSSRRRPKRGGVQNRRDDSPG